MHTYIRKCTGAQASYAILMNKAITLKDELFFLYDPSFYFSKFT